MKKLRDTDWKRVQSSKRQGFLAEGRTCDHGYSILASLSTDTVNMNLEHCTASRNQIGLHASVDDPGFATLRVSNSNIVGNGTGVVENGGGVVASRGNNTLESNGGGVNAFANFYTAK